MVVIGVGGPMVVAGTAVVPCCGAAAVDGAVWGAACVGAAAGGAGVAGAGVALCARAHVALHARIASVAIWFVIIPPAKLEQIGLVRARC